MNIRELCEKVRSEEITLNEAGHRTNCSRIELLKRYDDYLALAAGRNDGCWSQQAGETTEQVNAQMREHYQRILDMEIKQEDPLLLIDRDCCFGCGERLYWVLTGNQLQLRNFYDGNNFVNHPVDYVCPFQTPQPTRGEIKITSRLLFSNYFREIEDAPEGQRYDNEWSLNHLAGRKRITEYKAAQNVAYGQMGNMSIGVYVNQAKTSIIIGPSYHPAEMGDYDSDEEYEAAMQVAVFPGYEKVGEICLAVWRWEATDLNTLGDAAYAALLDEGRDVVELDVPHGVWTFEHHYDMIRRGDSENHLYAKLDLMR
jgi:hypothetical protein